MVSQSLRNQTLRSYCDLVFLWELTRCTWSKQFRCGRLSSRSPEATKIYEKLGKTYGKVLEKMIRMKESWWCGWKTPKHMEHILEITKNMESAESVER